MVDTWWMREALWLRGGKICVLAAALCCTIFNWLAGGLGLANLCVSERRDIVVRVAMAACCCRVYIYGQPFACLVALIWAPLSWLFRFLEVVGGGPMISRA
jgi:hypothetical protein